ncbi:WD40 repeat domain-containing protein [Corallococcus sp. M7]
MSLSTLTPSNAKHLEQIRQLGEPRPGPTYRGQTLFCDKGSNLLVSVEHGGAERLRWWALQDSTSVARISCSLPNGLAAVILPSRDVVLSVTVDGDLQEWSASDGAVLRGAQSGLTVAAMALGSDGNTLLLADASGQLILWDVARWQPQQELEPASAQLHCCALSEDGAIAAAGASVQQSDGSVQASVMLWNTRTGNRIAIIPADVFYIWDVSFAPSTRLLAAGTSVDRILLIDAERATVVRTLEGPAPGAHRLDFSPDGLLLAVATDNGAFRIMDVADGAKLYAYSDTSDMHVSPAVFTQDGRSVAWAEGSGQVGIWAVNR